MHFHVKSGHHPFIQPEPQSPSVIKRRIEGGTPADISAILLAENHLIQYKFMSDMDS